MMRPRERGQKRHTKDRWRLHAPNGNVARGNVLRGRPQCAMDKNDKPAMACTEPGSGSDSPSFHHSPHPQNTSGASSPPIISCTTVRTHSSSPQLAFAIEGVDADPEFTRHMGLGDAEQDCEAIAYHFATPESQQVTTSIR
jgi:hypothetical protein